MTPLEREMAKIAYEGVLAVAALIRRRFCLAVCLALLDEDQRNSAANQTMAPTSGF